MVIVHAHVKALGGEAAAEVVHSGISYRYLLFLLAEGGAALLKVLALFIKGLVILRL